MLMMSTTYPATRLPIVVNVGAPASLYDGIQQIEGGSTYNWPPNTVIDFSMRPLTSRTPILSQNAGVALAPPDLYGNNVRYDWSAQDISTAGEGEFFCWWGFTLQGASRLETQEFGVLISDHGPGLGAQTGAIVDGAARYLPVTFDYLLTDSRFGSRRMQEFANIVQTKVLGTTVTPDLEETYELILLEYLSKRVALDLIKPGIDFWSRQERTSTSTQTAEVTSFPDMIASLKELKVELARGLAEDWRMVVLLNPGVPTRTVVPMPATSLDGTWNVTKDPQLVVPLRTGWSGWSDSDLGFFPFP